MSPTHSRDGVEFALAYEQPERIRALVLVRPAWFTAVAADSLLAQFARPDAIERAAVLERLPADRPLPGSGPWPALTMPTLVSGTDRDPLHPLACPEALPAVTLRRVTSKTVDEGRHADEVATAIDDFLSATLAGAERAVRRRRPAP